MLSDKDAQVDVAKLRAVRDEAVVEAIQVHEEGLLCWCEPHVLDLGSSTIMGRPEDAIVVYVHHDDADGLNTLAGLFCCTKHSKTPEWLKD